MRDRQLLKRMQAVLDEEETRANENNESEDVDAEWDELFATPLAETVSKAESQDEPIYIKSEEKIIEPATTSIPSSTAAPPTATAPPALRNRLNQKPQSPTDSAKASGSNTHKNEKEQALSTHRLEQEDLTSSLVSLASQLKASSQSFQATLENEKSVLDRAVTGMDKTSATMEAAGKRMGMLRKMSEGKGWWGRMMLYAWIFGLWVVAILIVYVLPKFRF